MKKLLMLIIFSIMLISIGISGHNGDNGNAKHELYIPKNSYNISLDNAVITHTGSFDIVRVDSNGYDELRARIPGVIGESMSYTTTRGEVGRLVNTLDITIIKKKVDANGITIFGYSPRIYGGINLYGKRVNIQILYGNNRIEIGTPIIMGDY